MSDVKARTEDYQNTFSENINITSVVIYIYLKEIPAYYTTSISHSLFLTNHFNNCRLFVSLSD